MADGSIRAARMSRAAFLALSVPMVSVAAFSPRLAHAQLGYIGGTYTADASFHNEFINPITTGAPHFRTTPHGLELAGPGGGFTLFDAPLPAQIYSMPLQPPGPGITASAFAQSAVSPDYGGGTAMGNEFSMPLYSGLMGTATVVDGVAGNPTASLTVFHQRASFFNFGPDGFYPVRVGISAAMLLPPGSVAAVCNVGSAYSFNPNGLPNDNETGYVLNALSASGAPAERFDGGGIAAVNPDGTFVGGILNDPALDYASKSLSYSIFIPNGGSVTLDSTLTVLADPGARVKVFDAGFGEPALAGGYTYTNQTGDRAWTNPGNWQIGAVPNDNTTDIIFGNDALAPGSPAVVNMNGNKTVRSITFLHDAPGNYVIDPFLDAFSLNVNGADGRGSIEVWSPANEIVNAQVHNTATLTLLTADPAGALTFNGAVFTPNLIADGGGNITIADPVIRDRVIVQAGTLNLNHDAGIENGGLLNARVMGGARLNFGDRQHLTQLTVDPGAKTRLMPGGGANRAIKTKALAIAPGGQLDLGTGALVVDYTGASPLNAIQAQVASGYANGAQNGTGINSADAAANPGYALGYAEASSIFTNFPANFAGESVDSSAVLVRYTRIGDADLNRMINLLDFNRLAANFGQQGKVWSDGDFNYDGTVNLLDFNLLAGNFGLSAGADGVVEPGDWSALAAAVPEPSTVCLPFAAFAGLLVRRRRATALLAGRVAGGIVRGFHAV
jgi:hypothetical protein